MDEEDKDEKTKLDKKTHKSRSRKKKLLNGIQELMDFYFGDINLNHDRFLRKEIEQNRDGYIDLSTMLKFNQLKQLTSDITMLAKAVDNSSILELSEDRSKVKRKSKLCELENTDSRTVYVEEFPNNADHDWLKTVFSTCGTVEYISLPKYKHNNQAKGFAFIEFSSPGEAERACQVLDTVPTWKSRSKKRLSSGGTNSGAEDGTVKQKARKRRLSSGGTNSGAEDGTVKQKARKRRSTSESENNTTNKLITKRKRSISETSDSSPVKGSRKKGNNRCCIEEVTININKTKDIQKLSKSVGGDLSLDVSLSTSNKKKRRRDAGISSESENEQTPIKSGKSSLKSPVASSTPIQEADIDSPTLVLKADSSSSATAQQTSSSRKRKTPDEKKKSNKERTLQTSITNKDEIDDTETVNPKEITTSVCKNISKCDSDTDDSVKENLKKKTDPKDATSSVCEKILKYDSDSTDDSSVKDNLKTKPSADEADSVTSGCPRNKSDKQKRKASTSDKKHEIIEKKFKLEDAEKQETSTSKNTEGQEISFTKNAEKQNKNTEDTENVLGKDNELAINKTEDDEMVTKKKNRQHKKKGEGSVNEISVPPLHVIRKSEWLTLKKEYKRLQRVEMSKLKKTLKVLKYEEVRRVELKERIIGTLTAKGKIKESNESMISTQQDEKKAKRDFEEEKENVVELVTTNVECVVEEEKAEVKPKCLKTSSGTMVALKTSSEKLTKKSIRDSLSTFGQVAYVDYIDGVYQGFVRFSTSEDLEKVMNSSDVESWGFELRKLSDTEENEYFQKAEEDRLKKYDKDRKKKQKKKRGGDRISRDVESLSNHVHFT